MKTMKWSAIAIAALITVGCQEEPPEPEVSSPAGNYEQQPTTPPPYASNEPSTTNQSQQPSIDDVEKITLDELLELKEEDDVTIVDVRSAQYYVESHIPGSINIPAGQTSAMINMIPKNKKIVTYCT